MCVVYACLDVCGVRRPELTLGVLFACSLLTEAGPLAQPGAHGFQLVYSLAPDSSTLWPKCWGYKWLPYLPSFSGSPNLGLHSYPPGYLPRLCNHLV